jgi:lysozyme
MKKSPSKRIAKIRKKKSFFFSNTFYSFIFLVILSFFLFIKRNSIACYLGFKIDKTILETRNVSLDKVLDTHIGKSFGIDVSEYQNQINWDEIRELEGGYPIDFIFIRATVGRNKKDRLFSKYWLKAKENKLIRGAYHYYRPNENSILQAENFIKTVKLNKGDFPPVLDIEKLPRGQSIDSLKIGLKRWLVIVEKHYGVKPIIYSSESYYYDFLKDDFEDYYFWIANYTAFYQEIDSDWIIWQISENAKVSGICGRVDVNVYNGNLEELKKIVIN